MRNPPLSAAQQASIINDQGGATFKASNGAVNSDPGFMVAHEGTDFQYPSPVTATSVEEHAQRPEVISKVKQLGTSANHGWWDGGQGTTEGNVTEHINRPLDARRESIIQKQEATFANPGTQVRPGFDFVPIGGNESTAPHVRPARTAEEIGEDFGVEVNTNMRDIQFGHGRQRWTDGQGARAMIVGLNDVDPEYRMQPSGKEGDSEYTNYEVRARANEVIGGTYGIDMRKVSLQDVLNTINRGRVDHLRGQGVALKDKRGGFGWEGAKDVEHPPAVDAPPRPSALAAVGAMPAAQRNAIMSESKRGARFADGEARTTTQTRKRISGRRSDLYLDHPDDFASER